MKVAFLDRDGTIIKDYPDCVWSKIQSPEFFDDTIDSLKKIIAKNYKIIILTNQYIISEGFITHKQYKSFTEKFVKTLNDNSIDILDIFYCPHARIDNCLCCKPNKGMVIEAMNKYPNIDLSNSFIAGDSKCDEVLAKLLGIKFFKINYQDAHHKTCKLSSIIPFI